MEFGCVSLRVYHPSRPLGFLSDVLGLAPFRTWAAGTPRRNLAGHEEAGTYDTSYWVVRLEFDPRIGFLGELTHAVDLLSRSAATFHDLTATGGTIEIYVALTGWINNGDSIGPALMRTLSDLGVTLTIEVLAN
jgi:hypothetical protein